MTADVTERTGQIRGVNVRWVKIILAGHTVEQVLSYDVAEAEAVHGRPFDDELDRHIQMGMFAMDRISADGTMHKVASAASYVLDGKCVRTAKIVRCRDIEPMSAGWSIVRPDGTKARRPQWSCVPGTPPTLHKDLPADDDVTRFLRGVGNRVINSIQDSQLRPDRKSGWAASLGYGYRSYNLWYARPPWGYWNMSYRMSLRQSDDNEPGGSKWHGDVGFTYLKNDNEGLDRRLDGLIAVDSHTSRTDQVEDESGQVVEEYGVIHASLDRDALDEPFASELADTLRRFVEVITPEVDAFEEDRNAEGTLASDQVFFPVVKGKTVYPDDLPPENVKRLQQREKESIRRRKKRSTGRSKLESERKDKEKA